MPSYAITFRILQDDGYDKRYDSITKTIKDLNTGILWEETTSFYLIEFTGTASNLASDIYEKSEMGLSDLLVVMAIGSKDHASRGPIEDDTLLESFFA